jgi:hypothetical protein
VDRFSKAAQVTFSHGEGPAHGQHVFRIHGRPIDIVVLNSHPDSGRRSAPSLGCRPVCPVGFTPSPMASQSVPIRTWRRIFSASSRPTPPSCLVKPTSVLFRTPVFSSPPGSDLFCLP